MAWHEACDLKLLPIDQWDSVARFDTLDSKIQERVKSVLPIPLHLWLVPEYLGWEGLARLAPLSEKELELVKHVWRHELAAQGVFRWLGCLGKAVPRASHGPEPGPEMLSLDEKREAMQEARGRELCLPWSSLLEAWYG